MTGAEIAAEFTAVFTFASAKGHTAQMGAHAHGDQPFLLAFGGTLFERLRITKIAKRHSVGFGDFLGRQVTDEERLTAKNGLARLTGLNRADVDFRRGQCEHVSARVHLVHQRRNDRGGADARSEEHTSELQSLMRTSSPVFCLKTYKNNIKI